MMQRPYEQYESYGGVADGGKKGEGAGGGGNQELEKSVEAIRSSLDKVFAGSHTQFIEDDEFYYGEYHILKEGLRANAKNGEGFHEVVSMRARQDVNILTGHFKPDSFNVRVKPLAKNGREPNQAAKDQANGLEELGYDMLIKAGLRSSIGPLHDVQKHTFAHGVGPIRGVYDPKVWEKPPKQKASEGLEDFEYREAQWEAQRAMKFPYVLEAAHPAICMWWPIDADPEVFIRQGKVFPYDVHKEFPDYGISLATSFDEQPYLEFWDLIYKLFLVNRKVVNTKSTKNPYGFTPWSVVRAGLGKTDVNGKIEHQFQGVIHPLKGMIKEYSRRITSLSILVQAAALGRGYTRNAPEEFTLSGVPGNFKEIGDIEVGYFDMPPAPRELMPFVQIISNEMDDFVGTRQLGGKEMPGVASALGYELLREEATKLYQGMLENYQHVLARLCSQYFCIVENHIKEQMPGIKIKPSQIRGYYDCTVDLVQKDVAKERMMGALCKMYLDAGLYDLETLHGPEFLNSPNFSNIETGLLKDRIRNHEGVIDELAQMLMPSLKNKELLRRAEQRGFDARRLPAMSTAGGGMANLPAKTRADRSAQDREAMNKMFGQGFMPEMGSMETNMEEAM